jgi:hypothetical protein
MRHYDTETFTLSLMAEKLIFESENDVYKFRWRYRHGSLDGLSCRAQDNRRRKALRYLTEQARQNLINSRATRN